MEFTGGLILLAVAAALLFFGRGRGGDALPIFRNWLLATTFTQQHPETPISHDLVRRTLKKTS